MTRCAALFLACALDALLGDPYSMPHIIRLIGSLIAATERLLRQAFPQTPRGERLAGIVLVVLSHKGVIKEGIFTGKPTKK